MTEENEEIETFQASPRLILFFERLFKLKNRIEDIKVELNSIAEELGTLLQKRIGED